MKLTDITEAQSPWEDQGDLSDASLQRQKQALYVELKQVERDMENIEGQIEAAGQFGYQQLAQQREVRWKHLNRRRVELRDQLAELGTLILSRTRRSPVREARSPWEDQGDKGDFRFMIHDEYFSSSPGHLAALMTGTHTKEIDAAQYCKEHDIEVEKRNHINICRGSRQQLERMIKICWPPYKDEWKSNITRWETDG